MTNRELINEIDSVDDDVMNSEITILIQKKIKDDMILSIKGKLVKVDQNIDPQTGGLVFRVE